jgi:dipeptidyl aminopeptidase/acylaminoacyl peptidase
MQYVVRALLIALAVVTPALAQVGGGGSHADYERAATLAGRVRGKVLNTTVRPEWLTPTAFWYRSNLGQGKRLYWLVDAERAARTPLFDHHALAEAYAKSSGKSVDPERLQIERIEREPERSDRGDRGLLVLMRDDPRVWRLGTDGTLTARNATEKTSFFLPGSREPRLSRGSSVETSITFVNNTGESVKMFWIDTTGNRHPYDRLAPGGRGTQHTFAGHAWVAVGHDGRDLAIFTADERPSVAVIEDVASEQSKPAKPSSDSKPTPRSRRERERDARFAIENHNIVAIDAEKGERAVLTTDGTADHPYDGRFFVSPDGTKLVAMRTTRGGDRKVTYIESTPSDQLQPKIHDYFYLKPGDEIPLSKPVLIDLTKRETIRVSDELFPTPWSVDHMEWDADSSRFTFLYNQRGHRVMRLVAIDAVSGKATAIINEEPATFFDYEAKTYLYRLKKTGELIWMSERDGWNHLYLIDGRTGAVKNQITTGAWVVRGVDRVDEDARQIMFRGGGIIPGQDPYHVHFARVNLDGSGLTVLTAGDGTHDTTLSPDGAYFIDVYSRADLPPVTELRRTSDGSLVLAVEAADWAPLLETGWKPPQRFVAKGRDGQTDIYGLIYRPTNFDPSRTYPVIENIYAGPHDAHVPKEFRSYAGCQELVELGFIVVQIDGMGTNWRSKAFHDVAWKNLKDAGLADRIAWMKAAAAAHPEIDLVNGGRGVGIYGGSAGGQNAMAALLWHGDFYKAAVADCGCHDNRMDKIWWNELWMSWPVGPWYVESSNAANASRLARDAKLLLTVGEMDENVDPASTMQVVAALIKADKDFDLLVIPGGGHGAGETPYGRKRRQDFFVRHLMGREPRW